MPITLLCTMPACPSRLARDAGAGGRCPWLGTSGQVGRSLRVRGAPDQAPARQDTPASHGFFTGLVPKGRGSEDGEELRESGRREGLPGWNRGAAFEIRVGPGVPGPLLPTGGQPGVGSAGQEGGGSPGLRLGVGPGSAGGSQARGPWRMVSVLPALSKPEFLQRAWALGQGGPAVPAPSSSGPSTSHRAQQPQDVAPGLSPGGPSGQMLSPQAGQPCSQELSPQTRARPPLRTLCLSGRLLSAHLKACVLSLRHPTSLLLP